MKFAVSFSGGKDCILAMDRMVRAGHEPAALLVMVRRAAGRSWTHGLDERLLVAISDSLGIPLLRAEAGTENYALAMEDCLRRAMELGASGCVFGDIDIEAHRRWNEDRCRTAGLKAVHPLWSDDREADVREVMERGYRCVIKCVRRGVLPPALLGKTLSPEVLEELRGYGVDLCGENGEYHTAVTDGPLFHYPVETVCRGIVELEHIFAADLTLAR